MKSLVFWLSLLSVALLTGCGNEYPLTSNPGASDTSNLSGSIAADTFTWKGEKTLSSRTIPANATYYCSPGTQLLLSENATLSVKGSLVISGTEDLPVRIFCPSTATISIKGKLRAAHLISIGSGGSLFTGAGGSCVLDNISADGYATAIGGYFSSLTLRNATFNGNGAVISLSQDGDFNSSNIYLSDLTLFGVQITGSGRQTGVGISLNGTLATGANVLIQQALFSNLKSAVNYTVSNSKAVFTAVNVTVKNCIDGFAPISASQSAGFDTIIVSNSDISTREPAISLTNTQGVDLLIVENSNVSSKAESPMSIANDAATKAKFNQVALINKTNKAYSVATQVYDNIVIAPRVLSLELDTVAIEGRGMGHEFMASDTSTDTGKTTTQSLPAVPTIKSAVAGDSSATVTWLKSAYAKSYILYYAPGETVDETGSMIADAGLSKTIYGLTPGRKYTIAVRSVNNAGKSELSSPVTVRPLIKPSAPTIASLTASDGAVTITWNPVSLADSFNLYFQMGSTVDKSSAKYSNVTSPKTVSGLTNGVQYAFALSAINSAGESDLSPMDSAVPTPELVAPILSAITPANGSVTLSWHPVAGAAAYYVYYAAGTTVSMADARIPSGTSSKTVPNLVNNTQYAFAISAAFGSKESALSEVSTATPKPDPTTPGSPTNVTAVAGIGGVTMSWNPVAGATKYKVYFTAGTAVDKNSAAFDSAISPKTVSGLSNGTVYAFAVSAVNAVGESNLSAPITAMPIVIPGAPMISFVTGGDSAVTIAWSPVALATSYTLYYAAGAMVNKSGLKILSVTSPYTVHALGNGTKYAFAVAAANGAGESGLSDVQTATPGVLPPSAPTGVNAAPADSAEVTVTWNPVAGVTSYNIYYAQGMTVDTTTGTKIANASSPKTIGHLEPGQLWSFGITAANAGGQSAISIIASATPPTVSTPK